MFKENDPIVDSVRLVMEQNELRRQVEELVNEEFGVTSRKGLPHELYAEYDAVLAEAIEIALDEASDRYQALQQAGERDGQKQAAEKAAK